MSRSKGPEKCLAALAWRKCSVRSPLTTLIFQAVMIVWMKAMEYMPISWEAGQHRGAKFSSRPSWPWGLSLPQLLAISTLGAQAVQAAMEALLVNVEPATGCKPLAKAVSINIHDACKFEYLESLVRGPVVVWRVCGSSSSFACCLGWHVWSMPFIQKAFSYSWSIVSTSHML